MAPEAKALGPVIGLGFCVKAYPPARWFAIELDCGSHCLPRHLWRGAIAASGVVDPLRRRWSWPIPVSNRVAHVELLLCKGI